MMISGLNKEYLQDLNFFLEYADSPRGKENDEQYPQESFHLDFYLNHSKEELYDYINQFLTNNKEGQIIVVGVVFVKKTQKTTKEKIKLAETRLKEV